MNYKVDENGFFGKFGGAYVPEILYKCVTDLQKAYLPIMESEEFKTEYRALLRDYVGRPSPLYYAKRMSEKYGCQLYLKREDLNHTGAHKINNTVGQILMAKKMGKTRIIAETGAGQHGVATATVCALMNMECEIFMGKTDVERQHTNVERMKMLGAKVHPVTTADEILKARQIVGEVYIDEKIEQYIADIVFATRYPERYGLSDIKDMITFGGSPRASISLAKAARAYAFIKHRGYVIPEDVRAVAHDVLRHRVGLSYEAEASNVTSEEIVSRIINKVEVP